MNTPSFQQVTTLKQSLGVDVYATTLSLLCLLHCLALPLLTTFLPLAGQLSENELIHQVMVLLAAPATLWAVWNSLPKAATLWPFIVGACFGLTLLLLAGFIEAFATYETWLTVVGALCLASAHIWRWSRHIAVKTAHSKQ